MSRKAIIQVKAEPTPTKKYLVNPLGNSRLSLKSARKLGRNKGDSESKFIQDSENISKKIRFWGVRESLFRLDYIV